MLDSKTDEYEYKDMDLVAERVSIFHNKINQLSTTYIKFDYELQMLLLLSFMFDNWEVFGVTLIDLISNRKLSMLAVKENMLNEEAKKKVI